MGYSHKKCEDEDDAARMAEVILRELGYSDVQKGSSVFTTDSRLPKATLANIAVNAERIARWARNTAKGK